MRQLGNTTRATRQAIPTVLASSLPIIFMNFSRFICDKTGLRNLKQWESRHLNFSIWFTLRPERKESSPGHITWLPVLLHALTPQWAWRARTFPVGRGPAEAEVYKTQSIHLSGEWWLSLLLLKIPQLNRQRNVFHKICILFALYKSILISLSSEPRCAWEE